MNDQIHELLEQLPLQEQDIVAMLIRQLAERQGIEARSNDSAKPACHVTEIASFTEGLNLYRAQMDLDGMAKSTITNYTSEVKQLLAKYNNPTALDIERFLAERLEQAKDDEAKQRARNTIGNYIKAFRSFFRYLHLRGFCNIDPTTRLKQPKVIIREKRIPSDADVQKLLATVDNAEIAIALILFIDCGVRVHELATIRIEDIDLDKWEIIIFGKGARERTIDLNEQVVGYLAQYLQMLAERNNVKYLFPTKRKDAKQGFRENRFFQLHLAGLCSKAGIEPITPHQLRHYCATYHLAHGADIKSVSEMLGHSDVMITLKVYHHAGRKAIKEMHRKHSPFAEMPLRLTNGNK